MVDRTDAQIVADANVLAREFYRLMGYIAPPDFRFDRARHPQERLCWMLAVAAYEHIDGTDVADALSNLEDTH